MQHKREMRRTVEARRVRGQDIFVTSLKIRTPLVHCTMPTNHTSPADSERETNGQNFTIG